MYTALTVFGSLAGLLALGISLFNHVRSSHHTDVINHNARSLRDTILASQYCAEQTVRDLDTHEANIKSIIDIGNHNDELVRATFKIVGDDADGLRLVVSELDTLVSDLRDELLEAGEVLDVMLDTQGVQANTFEMLLLRIEALEQSLAKASPAVPEVVDVEFTEVGGLTAGGPALEVHALEGCFGESFRLDCEDCLKLNALSLDILESTIQNDGIKDVRYQRIVNEDEASYRERIGDQLRSDKERGATMPSLPANLLPEGTTLVRQGNEVAYYFAAPPSAKNFATVIPPEAVKSVEQVIAERQQRTINAIADQRPDWDRAAADLYNREFGAGDNQVIG